MPHYETSIDIDAGPDVVWSTLAAGGYDTWDSGVTRLEGRVADGEKITLWSEAAPDRAFPLKVEMDEPGRTMTWRGGMPIPGLFTGVRTFRVQPAESGSTFAMREDYRGILVGPILSSMPDLQPSFDQFAAALKARAESAGTR